MRIGVIASMKKGLEPFVYRELVAFEKNGASISLFPTKHQAGLCNPSPQWHVHRWKPLIVILLQPVFFLRAPLLYLRLLSEAISTNTLQDALLAWYFSSDMWKVDVIYAHFGDHKFFVGYYAKRIVGKPLAVTIHAYELYNNPSPTLFIRALRYCDQIITVTEYNRRLLLDRFGVDPTKLDVVRITVDVEDYRPGKKFSILIVAFFTEKKGHEVLFNAIKLLNEKDIDVWVVGGEGGADPIDVRQLAVKCGIENQVAFFGKLGGNALKALYRSCDVFCLPSRTTRSGDAEGFPTVLAEAMAFAKPVISTRHVEIPYVIDEVLVDENDAPGLARAIAALKVSRTLRERLGEKNRQTAERLFTTNNAKKTLGILNRLAQASAQAECESPAFRSPKKLAYRKSIH
jgi:glycosyltransferase involved in cell wall biosynthesis